MRLAGLNDSGGAGAKPVGIWLRVSTEDQAQGDSPQHHERRARHYADAKGWIIREIYDLSGVSGKSILDHPQTKRMLDDIRLGRITGLIFSKMARLARNTRELLELSDIFRECGADLISLNEAVDTTSPAGRLFYTMIAALAQWEREEISERVAASVPIRAQLGKPLGGAAPFGYRWKAKKLVIDPAEAPIRAEIFDLFLEHRRKKTVAQILNDRGIRTRSGSLFSIPTIDRLLRDPTAKGLHRSNYTTQSRDGRCWIQKPEAEWVHTPVEPIVSEAIWDQCQALLGQMSHGTKRGGRRPVRLFAGFIRCNCGEKMYVPTKMKKYYCPRCRNGISTADLENTFRRQLVRFYAQGDGAEAGTGAVSASETAADTIQALADEHRLNCDEIERLYKLCVGGNIDFEEFEARRLALELRQEQLAREIPALRAHLNRIKINRAGDKSLFAEARDMSARWSTLDFAGKRRVIERTTQRIVVGKAQVSVLFKYTIYSRKTVESAVQSVTVRRSVRDFARPAGPARESGKARRFKKT